MHFFFPQAFQRWHINKIGTQKEKASVLLERKKKPPGFFVWKIKMHENPFMHENKDGIYYLSAHLETLSRDSILKIYSVKELKNKIR